MRVNVICTQRVYAHTHAPPTGMRKEKGLDYVYFERVSSLSCVCFDMCQGMRLYRLSSICEDVFVVSTSWRVMYAEAVRVCVCVRAHSGSYVSIYGVGF